MKHRVGSNKKIICLNRKASFNYFFLEVLEAGVALKGSEVKSLRDGKGSIADSYALDKNGEIMSLKHKKYNVRGVQFHPESVLTPRGKKMIKNWVKSI